jgi:putative flippase GtrA
VLAILKKIDYKININILKFILTGFLNTLFGYILYVIMQKIFGNFHSSLIIVYVIGLFFNYFTYNKIAFKTQAKNKFKNFVFIYVIFLLLNIILMNFALQYFKNDIILQAIFIPFFATALYFSLKKMVFKNDKK